MSTINGVSGNAFNITQVTSNNLATQQGGDSDGDHDGSSVGKASANKGGQFSSAVTQALAQIGVTGSASSSTSTTSSTQGPQQALAVFMHDLFAALQGASGNSSSTTNGSQQAKGRDQDSDSDGSGAAAAVSTISSSGRQNAGGLSGIESKLQKLIQQLSVPVSASTAPNGSSSDSATVLQSDFKNLLGALGASGNQATLGSFLQAISNNIQGGNPGLNISTKV